MYQVFTLFIRMSGSAAVTENGKKKSKKSKSPKKPKDLEDQENSTAQDLEKPIECPDCNRRFQKMCHLKYHSVIHQPGRTESRSKKKRSGSSKKGGTEKANTKADTSEGDVITASEKHQRQKHDPDRIEAQEVASSARAPFSDLSNAELSSPVAGSLAIDDPPPRVASAEHSGAPPDRDDHKPEISASAEENRENEPAAAASEAQDEEDAAIDSWIASPADDTNESSRASGTEEPASGTEEPAAVPAAIEEQPQPAEPINDQLELVEIIFLDDIDEDFLPAFNCSPTCESEVQPEQDLMQRVEALSPIDFPYVDSADLFVEGVSLLLDGIDLAESITTCKVDYLQMLEMITGEVTCDATDVEDGEDEPSFGNDYFLDHCEDVVPDDFYEVLSAVTLQQSSN